GARNGHGRRTMRRVHAVLATALAAVMVACSQPKTVATLTPAELKTLAHDYYAWRDSSYPVASSDQGLHTWDNRLTDFTMTAVTARRTHVRDVLARIRDVPAGPWR